MPASTSKGPPWPCDGPVDAPLDIGPDADERARFALTRALGNITNAKISTGEVYRGVLHCVGGGGGADAFVVLRKARKVKSADGSQAFSADVIEFAKISRSNLRGMSIGLVDLRQASEAAGKQQAGEAQSEKGKPRELVRWDESEESSETTNGAKRMCDINDLDTNKPPAGWDQFERNWRRFGVESTYDETKYTTKINKEMAMSDKEASRIASDILRKPAHSTHQQEERGEETEEAKDKHAHTDKSEEDKYAAAKASSRKPEAKGEAKGTQATQTRGENREKAEGEEEDERGNRGREEREKSNGMDAEKGRQSILQKLKESAKEAEEWKPPQRNMDRNEKGGLHSNQQRRRENQNSITAHIQAHSQQSFYSPQFGPGWQPWHLNPQASAYIPASQQMQSYYHSQPYFGYYTYPAPTHYTQPFPPKYYHQSQPYYHPPHYHSQP